MVASLRSILGAVLLLIFIYVWFLSTWNMFYPILVFLGAMIIMAVYHSALQKGKRDGYRQALRLQGEPLPLNRLTEQTYFVVSEWYEAPWSRKVYALALGDPTKIRNYAYFFALDAGDEWNPYEFRKEGELTLLVRKSDNVLRKLSLHDGSSCARCGERVELVGVQVACANCGFVYFE